MKRAKKTKTDQAPAELISAWIKNNGPFGISKLSVASGVSPATIRNICRKNAPKMPQSPLIQRALADILGVDADVFKPTLHAS